MKLCGKAKAMSMFAGKTKKKERKKILNNSELVSGDTCIFVCFLQPFSEGKGSRELAGSLSEISGDAMCS